MKFATVLAVAAAACVVSGSPLRKRQLSNSGNNDITILNFALLLETLEFEFYNTGLKKFGEADFRRANIPNPTQAILNFHHILQHEAKHVETLKAVIKSLGGEAIPKCEFEFPMDSVQTFTKLASVLEKTGVAAYNGAVNLLKNPDLQTAAANIDTVEARHASFLQTVNGLDPFPADFDVALDGRQVVTLAAPVIKACPFELPFAPFGALKVDESEVLLPGGECKVKFKREGEQQHFCNFVFSDQSLVSELSSDNKCEIPDEARGDVFLMITSSEKGVTLKDTNAVVAGPVVLNVDTAHDDSCQRFVGKDGENTVDSLEVPHQMPKHEMPKHEMPKHEMPKHEMPKHEMPKHEMPKHEMPSKKEKDCKEAGEKKDTPPEIQAQIEKVEEFRKADAKRKEEREIKKEMMEKEMPPPEEAAPEEAAPEEAAPEEAAPEEAAPEEAAPEEAAPEEAAPEEAAPEEAALEEAAPEEAAPEEAAVAPEEVAVAPEEVPLEKVSPETVAPEEAAAPASDIEFTSLPGTESSTSLVASTKPVIDMSSTPLASPASASDGETPLI